MDRASIRIEDESTESEVELYPPRFWGLDPLFSAKIKLNIKDVLSLANYPEYPGQFSGHAASVVSKFLSFVQVSTALVITLCWVCT